MGFLALTGLGEGEVRRSAPQPPCHVRTRPRQCSHVCACLHRPLTADGEELVARARSTIDAGTDEDGVHAVGAAVRADDGRIFCAVNLYHVTGGLCAELVALGTARAQGARKLTHIVAVGNHGRGPLGPCGRDRQVLLDYHPGIRVILPIPEGVRSVAIDDLMPLATGWSPGRGSKTL